MINSGSSRLVILTFMVLQPCFNICWEKIMSTHPCISNSLWIRMYTEWHCTSERYWHLSAHIIMTGTRKDKIIHQRKFQIILTHNTHWQGICPGTWLPPVVIIITFSWSATWACLSTYNSTITCYDCGIANLAIPKFLWPCCLAPFY